MARPTGRSKEKQVAPTQVLNLEAMLVMIPDEATSSALPPHYSKEVNLNTTLYERFMLLVKNSNRIMKCVNLTSKHTGKILTSL